MREILFRGKETETGEWYYGGFFPHKQTTYCFKEDYDAHPEIEQPCIVFDEMTDWGLPNRVKRATVDPETVGQYTGMTDKNGTKIFEGDIVEAWSQGVKARGEVRQRIDGFWLMYPAWQNGKMWGLCPNFTNGTTTVEIIGNIHDNPELLKEEIRCATN